MLAFTDADCVPEPTWLAAGLAALEQADLVQGRVAPDPAVERGPFDRTIHVDQERGFYEAANLLLRRDLFERLGGFEDWLEVEIGKPLAEDVWLGWHARRKGARTVFCPEALVYHAVFPRGPADYVAERRRLRYFPAMARRIPELRDAMFYRRWFLTRRSAEFDAAVVALALCTLTRKPLPALAALPYARTLYGKAKAWRRTSALVTAADVAADAVGFAALVRGSIRYRTPVL
jgi:hypothetical protein